MGTRRNWSAETIQDRLKQGHGHVDRSFEKWAARRHRHSRVPFYRIVSPQGDVVRVYSRIELEDLLMRFQRRQR